MIDQLFEFVQNHLLLSGAFLVVLVAWIAYELKGSNSGVSPSEATSLINREEGLFLDIREVKDFKAGHIAGARNIPKGRLEDRLKELEDYKEKPVVVVCQHGQHSGAAVGQLTQGGFTRATKLKGGMTQWQSDELPVVRK